jgi:hypothetical protein
MLHKVTTNNRAPTKYLTQDFSHSGGHVPYHVREVSPESVPKWASLVRYRISNTEVRRTPFIRNFPNHNIMVLHIPCESEILWGSSTDFLQDFLSFFCPAVKLIKSKAAVINMPLFPAPKSHFSSPLRRCQLRKWLTYISKTRQNLEQAFTG